MHIGACFSCIHHYCRCNQLASACAPCIVFCASFCYCLAVPSDHWWNTIRWKRVSLTPGKQTMHASLRDAPCQVCSADSVYMAAAPATPAISAAHSTNGIAPCGPMPTDTQFCDVLSMEHTPAKMLVLCKLV